MAFKRNENKLTHKYRVALVANGKHKYFIYQSDKRELSYTHYKTELADNKIDFPQRFATSNILYPVKYKLYFCKKREPEDRSRYLRDEYGRLYEESIYVAEGIEYTILDSADFDLEETFNVFGYNPKTERFTIRDIIKRLLMVNILNKGNVKEVKYLRNKLMLTDNFNFHIIVCKCESDAKRLHNKLREITQNNKLKTIIFNGHVKPEMVDATYVKICQKTGWAHSRAKRIATHTTRNRKPINEEENN